jgi:hypothetical protein
MNTVQLELECRTYTRYLIGRMPTEYIVEKYLDCHQKLDTMAAAKPDRFDQFLVGVSARGPFWARLADSYVSLFSKDSAVRKKLVLTLALLECAPPSFEKLDQPQSRGMAGAIVRLSLGAMRYALTLVSSVVIFTPIRLGMAVSTRSRHIAVTERR